MSTGSQATTNVKRMREAGVNPGELRWFLAMTNEDALDRLPAEALFLPGQQTTYGETLVDLKDGRPIYLQEVVPSGTVFCLLGPLKPMMRTEAQR